MFDVTLDCEDGAPVGGEPEHAHLVAEMAMSSRNVFGRCGVRLHPVDHPSFGDDVATIAGRAGSRIAYVMLPKVDGVADVQHAADAIDAVSPGRAIPLHALIETPRRPAPCRGHRGAPAHRLVVVRLDGLRLGRTEAPSPRRR